jgi:hypothetical protein
VRVLTELKFGIQASGCTDCLGAIVSQLRKIGGQQLAILFVLDMFSQGFGFLDIYSAKFAASSIRRAALAKAS